MTADCEPNLELLLESLDGPLSTADQLRFETHLAACPACVEALREHVLLRSALHEIGTADAEEVAECAPGAPLLSDALVSRFVTAMRDSRDGRTAHDHQGGSGGGSGGIGEPGDPGSVRTA